MEAIKSTTQKIVANMTPLPKTYKAASFESKGAKLTLKDVELKQPIAGQVLVKVLASGVCHSDAGVQAGAFVNSFPIIPGHEIIGNVVAVGDGVEKWKVGDRVGGGWHGGHDGSCRECNKGMFQMCSNAAINGVTINDGGFAEYVLLRSEAVVRVPSDVDPAAYAPILCAGVTVFNAIRRLNITAGEVVAIQGLGGLGHLAVQFAHKMGYQVVALSSGDKKRDFAKELGADIYVDTSKEDACEALQKLGGAALIVATAPNPDAIGPLTGGLMPAGKLLILAPCGEVKINTIDLIVKGASVCGWPSGHALDSEDAFKFCKAKDVNCMVETFKLEDAQKAFDHMMSGKVRFRSVLVME